MKILLTFSFILATILLFAVGILLVGWPAFFLMTFIIIQIIPIFLISFLLFFLIKSSIAKNRRAICVLVASLFVYLFFIAIRKDLLYSGEYKNEFWVEYYYWKIKNAKKSDEKEIEKYKRMMMDLTINSEIECKIDVFSKLKNLGLEP